MNNSTHRKFSTRQIYFPYCSARKTGEDSERAGINGNRTDSTNISNRVWILCQDENGPCGLLALANILSLKGDLDLDSLVISKDGSRGHIILEDLLQSVANHYIEVLHRKLR